MQFLDIVAQVAHELSRQGRLKWPKVYLHPSCAGEAAFLQKAITSLRGELAPQPGKLISPVSAPAFKSALTDQ